MPAIIPIRAIQEKLTFPALRSVELVMSMANVMPAVVPMPKGKPLHGAQQNQFCEVGDKGVSDGRHYHQDSSKHTDVLTLVCIYQIGMERTDEEHPQGEKEKDYLLSVQPALRDGRPSLRKAPEITHTRI